jgi:hypothetical protein
MRPAATSGGDALSGLARAFYAGARALLVSHRYVDSNATVALITKFVGPLKADPRWVGSRRAIRPRDVDEHIPVVDEVSKLAAEMGT